MTAASLDPSDDDVIEDPRSWGADVSVHDAPESVLLQMRPPSMTAASFDPSEDDAIESHSAWGAYASVHAAPESVLLQMRSWSGSEELTTAPTARPRAPSIVFLFGGTHEWSCHGKLLFPAVEVMGGRVRSVALSGGG